MSLCLNRIPGLLATFCVAAVLAAGAATAQADGQGQQGPPGAMQGHGGQGGGMHGGKHGKGHGGGGQRRGGGGMRGKAHGKDGAEAHLFGPNWKKTLTAEQKTKLDQLHLEFARNKAPLHARIEALKVQLAVLVTSEQPEAIDGQIEELVQAKRELISAKYQYTVAKREVLTPPQRVSFDMEVLHRAMHGDQKKSAHGAKDH